LRPRVRENRSLQPSADRRFVIVSGLPGSGKSRLACELAPLLGLEVIDKDEILERLFDSRGVGDAAWRRTLSRESDLILQREAEASDGALLVSFWRLPGMSRNSGTPTDWLSQLSGRILNLHCECPAEISAARFGARKRHPGHLDSARSLEQILESIRDLEKLKTLEIGPRVPVDTSVEVNAEEVAGRLAAAFSSLV
jgi:predicted kinase